MRRFVVGLLTAAYKVVFKYEGEGPHNRMFDIDSKTNLPTTILSNFTNCCINVIFEAKKNNRDYSEFFRIFPEIISCGHEVAEYLISKKVVGRLMDFFYEAASPLNSFFRDLSDVPFKEPTSLELGQPQEEKKKVRSAWEEFMLKRKDRQASESHAAQKSYLWKAVNLLLLHCRISDSPKRCEWQIGDYDCEILNDEKALLMPDSKFIEKSIQDAQSKIGYRNVAQFYSYLCYEEEKFSGVFMKAIQMGFAEVGSSSIANFMRCFATLLTLKDSLTKRRVS